MCAKRDAGAARLLDERALGSFERFKTKTHFNSLKRLVGVTALAALAVKLLTMALATAAGDGTPLDLLARVPASLADLGAALLVFEVLRTRRPLQLAARSAILVAVSPVLFVASGLHGDRIGVAVALPLLAIYLLIDRDAPLVAGITLAIASRVEPMALLAAPVAMAAIAAGADGPEPDDGRARRSRMVHFGGALVGALGPTRDGPRTVSASLAPRTVLKVLEPGKELLLFRLGDRGYASAREQVREVVDVGAGQPAVPGLSPSSLGGLGGGQRPVALVSLRVALGLPDRGPEGRILVVATRTGPVGFLVDEVVRVLRYDPASHPPEATRLSGYVTASFQARGGSWLLIDWDAIRLPAGITAPR